MKQRFTFNGKGTKNFYGVSPETAARAKFLQAAEILMPGRSERRKHDRQTW